MFDVERILSRQEGLVYEVANGEQWIGEHNRQALAAVTGQLATVVDVGAHIGFTTLPAAQRHALVYALEPNPFNYATLIRNLERNQLTDWVVPLQVGLAEADSQLAALKAPRRNVGNTGFCQADNQQVVAHVMTISPATLFGWLPPSIDYLKMDIEGYEHYVLPHFTPQMWQRIRWFHLEIHDVESPAQKRFHASWGKNTDLVALLTSHGFLQIDGLPVWKNQSLVEATCLSA